MCVVQVHKSLDTRFRSNIVFNTSNSVRQYANTLLYYMTLIISYINLYSLIAYKIKQEVITGMLVEFTFPHTYLDLF